ncbi:glycosyltransferase [Bowmanella yangjiangensis]|uniref:Glycosyltransferase n=1 Tax=Bowmanella yangjiangensis TaxID=2811230 RepID=A0ABS3CVM7_9ALTE|nr:glycosyltransferase [Bowmanella yangjiangensis]MBN7820375.1 glycosyltransferase [Bowmanella yangjiangensis]
MLISEQAARSFSHFDIIAIAPNIWTSQWMNRQQLMSRIGGYTKVVYSSGLPFNWQRRLPGDLFYIPTGKFEKMDNVWVDTPPGWMIRTPRLPRLERFVLAQHAERLQKNLSNKPRLLYVFHPMFASYLDHITVDKLVYHPYDDFAKQGTFSPEMAQQEARLMAEADLVITPSQGVSEELAKRYGRDNVETVHNGVDFEAFSQPSNSSIKLNEGQNIAYLGSINVKVDIPLLLEISRQLPSTFIHLVGPVGVMGDKQRDFEQLKQRHNVILHGPVSHQALPGIAQQMDCLLMCYDTSPTLWARHAYPLKLNEYLATKRPVVSCPLPSVPDLSRLLSVAQTPAEWVDAIQEILVGQYQKLDTGFSYAQRQDWNSRVEQIGHLLMF